LNDDTLDQIRDRLAVTEAVYRYPTSVDAGDWAALRAAFVDDARVRFGNGDWIVGADVLVRGLQSHMKESLARHHLVSVYRVEVNGDDATALSYATSHVVMASDPGLSRVSVGRYHEQLVRTSAGWKISAIVYELVWAEDRRDSTNRLVSMGGRGPASISF
jgi:hypothetical protein